MTGIPDFFFFQRIEINILLLALYCESFSLSFPFFDVCFLLFLEPVLLSLYFDATYSQYIPY